MTTPINDNEAKGKKNRFQEIYEADFNRMLKKAHDNMTTPLKQSEEAEIRLKRAYKSFMSLRPLANEDPMWDVAEAMWNRQEDYWQRQLAQSKVEIEQLKKDLSESTSLCRSSNDNYMTSLDIRIFLGKELAAEKLLSSQLKSRNNEMYEFIVEARDWLFQHKDMDEDSYNKYSKKLVASFNWDRERELRKENDPSCEKVKEKEDLLPCPFCGGKPRRQYYPTLTLIHCDTCKFHIHSGGPYSEPPIPHEDLFARWNRRASQATKSEPLTDSACKIKELSDSLTAAKEAIRFLENQIPVKDAVIREYINEMRGALLSLAVQPLQPEETQTERRVKMDRLHVYLEEALAALATTKKELE